MMLILKLFWIFFVSFAVSVSGQDSSEEDIGCVSPWQQVHRSCMQLVLDLNTYADARSYCQNQGGDLVSISDKQEMNRLKPIIKKAITSQSYLDWWVGLEPESNETDGRRSWRWIDGSPYIRGVISWAQNEPNNGYYPDGFREPEDCVVYDYRNVLKDVPCSGQKPFVCEEWRSTTTVTSPTTVTTTKKPITSSITPSTSPSTPKSSPAISSSPKSSPATESRTSSRSTSPTIAPTSSSISASSSETPVMTTTDKTNKTKKTKATVPTRPTKKPTTPVMVSPSTSPTLTTMSIDQLRDEFRGCYAINFESTCPPTEALGIFWPRTEPGKKRTVDCESGQATWHCSKNPTCWKGEPDVKKCTSENIQNLSDQLDDVLSNEDNTDAVMEFTEDLANTIQSDSVMSEQDIYASTKLLDGIGKANPKNTSSAKTIIKNVVKCGNSLVAKDKSNTWKQMKTENKKLIASSLLNSMETVTKEMMKAIDEPTVATFTEETMEVELRVVDVNSLQDIGRVEIYKGKQNSFFVAPATLKEYSSNGLSRMVIINYNNIAELLPPEDFSKEGGVQQEIISQVMSASLGGQTDSIPLAEPISYTFNTANRVQNKDWKQMCSFWNFSLGYTGAWSQKGCSLKTYNETHTTCQCNHLTNFAILMDIHQTPIAAIHATTLSYVTYVGIIISIICLFLSWVTFICLGLKCMRHSHRHSHECANNQCQELYGSSGNSSSYSTTNHLRTVQGERNSIHKHLVFCLFVAEVLFLAGVERTEHKMACSLIAGFLHYFFLASFTWMFIEGIHILFMLVQVFDAAKSRMKYYYVLGYGAPLTIVGVSAAIFHEGYGTEKYCWLTAERFFMWSFAGPIAFILIVNMVILVYAMAAVCKHADYVFTKEKSSSNLKGWIQGALALEVLLGLTWVFGYFYINDQLITMAYLFTIFNSLQGLFIFLFHCLLNKKVRKEYERFIQYKPTSSSTTNTHSKSANGSAGTNTASYALANSRKPSTGFTDLHVERKQSEA